MTRRQAWRVLLGLFLAFPTRVAHGEGGVLSIDLGQWKHIHVKFKDRSIVLTSAQLFEALR